MSAGTLRRAAAVMRERAEAATPGPWRQQPIGGPSSSRADVRGLPENTTFDYRGAAVATAADSYFGACPATDAAHIASWHPAVALAVADWLETAADHFDPGGAFLPVYAEALAVARTYLKEDA